MFRYNVVRGGDGLGGRKSLVGKKDEDVDSQKVGIKLEYTVARPEADLSMEV